IYFLEPDGAVVDSLALCHVTANSLLENLAAFERGSGPTLVPPADQAAPPPGTQVLHLTSRYLDKEGKPLKFSPRASYHAFPAEEWVALTPAEEAGLVPDAAAAPGATWYVDMAVAARLLSRFYPLTGNFGPSDRNRIEEAGLSATVVSGRHSVAWIRLNGHVRLGHTFMADKDERPVQASVTGYLEYDRQGKKVRALRLVTEQAFYGKESFCVALTEAR
ncbi:MAG: hypothetical protein HY293_16595, partial [Planctomycetes bacterium]|nr:hypothetical protein [Planctomycetota bacterium]